VVSRSSSGPVTEHPEVMARAIGGESLRTLFAELAPRRTGYVLCCLLRDFLEEVGRPDAAQLERFVHSALLRAQSLFGSGQTPADLLTHATFRVQLHRVCMWLRRHFELGPAPRLTSPPTSRCREGSTAGRSASIDIRPRSPR
jgi:hypothetical protein